MIGRQPAHHPVDPQRNALTAGLVVLRDRRAAAARHLLVNRPHVHRRAAPHHRLRPVAVRVIGVARRRASLLHLLHAGSPHHRPACRSRRPPCARLSLPRITRIFTNFRGFSCQFVQFVAKIRPAFSATNFTNLHEFQGLFVSICAIRGKDPPSFLCHEFH